MTMWKSSIKRSQGQEVRKEDLVPISVKITKKVPYYDWTEYYVQFKNDDTKYWVRYNICLPKPDMKVENILPILAEHGLDSKNVSIDGWPELIKGSGRYQEFDKWRKEQWKVAEQEGSTEKEIEYSYTTKKLRGTNFRVSVTMRMYGAWRRFKYVFAYNSDEWSYEDDKTGETRYYSYAEAIRKDVKNMIDLLPHTRLTKEEWDDDNFFKEMHTKAKDSINNYNRNRRYYW